MLIYAQDCEPVKASGFVEQQAPPCSQHRVVRSVASDAQAFSDLCDRQMLADHPIQGQCTTVRVIFWRGATACGRFSRHTCRQAWQR